MCCKLHAHIKFFGFIFQDRVSLAILEPRLTYLFLPDAGIKDVRHYTWQRLFFYCFNYVYGGDRE